MSNASDLLDALKHEDGRAEAWRTLTDGLKKHEYAHPTAGELGKWKTEFKQWQGKPDSTVAAASLRLLGHVARDLNDKSIKNLIVDAAENKEGESTPDVHAWALFVLAGASYELSKQEGERLLKALDDNHSKVRQWAVFALGRLSEEPRKGRYGSYLVGPGRDEMRAMVMQRLVARWDEEIDVFVQRELVMALGRGGHLLSDREGLREVLKKAARHGNPVVWSEVPETIGAIARQYLPDASGAGHPDDAVRLLRILQSEWFADEQDAVIGPSLLNVVRVLVDLTEEAVKKGIPAALEPLLDATDWAFKQTNLDYESVRSLVAAMEQVVPLAHAQEATRSGCVAGIKSLVDLATCKEGACEERPRIRALQAIAYLGRMAQTTDSMRELLTALGTHVEALKRLVRGTNEEFIQAAADALTMAWGEANAAGFFVNLILDDGDGSVADSPIRRLAARSLGVLSLETKKTSIERLAAAVKNQEDASRRERAHIALAFMGGSEAVSALVGIARRKWVEDKYFNRIDELDEHADVVLRDVRKMANRSYTFANWTATAVVAIGGALAAASLYAISKDSGTWMTLGPGIAAVVAGVGGILVPFFFNPANAVQRASAEMTKVMTAFMGYSGRMRLLGLGFAAEYTKDAADLAFLKAVNDSAGTALADSCNVLNGVAAWPGVSAVEVPKVTDMKWDDAVATAKPFGLGITLEKLDFSDKVDENEIIEQSPPAKSQATVGTVISVVVSKGKKESAAGGNR